MRTPPLLLGATLLFWGWQSDYLVAGAVMGAILESARLVKARWELADEDLSRIWIFCGLLFLGVLVYAFTENDGPANFSGLFKNPGFNAQVNVGNATSRTAMMTIRWLPISYFLFMVAQAFGNRDTIPLHTISHLMKRQRERARKRGYYDLPQRNVNVAWPYFIVCLFSASGHASDDNTFFWGLWALLAWALWPRRARRFGLLVWVCAMTAAMGLGFGGQRGLVQFQKFVGQYNPQWMQRWIQRSNDPTESRTQIGQIGRIKLSGQILVRLETKDGQAPPPYLREASYRGYRSPTWFAGSSASNFNVIAEEPLNSGHWQLLPAKTNALSVVNIACYLDGWRNGSPAGLLPLPPDVGRLENLPAYVLQKNSVGAVLAEGPGLVIFNAYYGPGAVMDFPPNTNEDLAVPERELPALQLVVAELNFTNQSRAQKLVAIERYFETKFTYSLWQDGVNFNKTNATPLGVFLQRTRSGHCEYFATATVLLLRQLGIPARYTVGYAVHEGLGGKYFVRGRDAHAWCRAWDADNKTWDDFDTTPGSWVAEEGERASAWQFLSDAWARIKFEIAKFRWGQSHFRKYILWFLVPVLGLLLWQIIARSAKRRAAGKPGDGPVKTVWPGLDSEFYQLERALVKRGVMRQPSETLSDWLECAAAVESLTELRETLRRILRLHYRYRFDPPGLAAEDRETLRREVAACLSALANPTS